MTMDGRYAGIAGANAGRRGGVKTDSNSSRISYSILAFADFCLATASLMLFF